MRVRGAQIGLLNVARRVKGWQVGVTNISGRIDGGLPIGLINYSRNGVFSLSTWRDEVGFNLLTLASGSRLYHTSFTTGFASEDGRRLWAIGLGAGVRKSGRRLSIGLDVHGLRISRDLGEDYDADIDFWPPLLEASIRGAPSTSDNSLWRIRLETGVVLAQGAPLPGRPWLFGGLSLNRWSTKGHPRLIESGSRFEEEPEDGVFVWPGYFLGLRFGR